MLSTVVEPMTCAASCNASADGNASHICQAASVASTLALTCHRKPERGTSGGWRQSGAVPDCVKTPAEELALFPATTRLQELCLVLSRETLPARPPCAPA